MNHPEMRIALCGKAVPSDRARLAGGAAQAAAPENDGASEPATQVSDFALLALARARRGVVVQYLTNEHAVPARQLLACAPAIEETDGALPRVEFHLAGQTSTEAAPDTQVSEQEK